MSKLRQTAVGGGKLLSLVALAIILLGFAAPAHAADDNTVSIAVDQNAALQPAGTLYKATTNVKVTTGKPYGFNLTMQADTADLINSKDQTHKISATPSTTPVALNANQWGYALSNSATTFSAVPVATQSQSGATATPTATQPSATAATPVATPAVIADVTKAKPAGCTNPANCTKQVTFAANIDPANLASGSYSTTITYTATAKPAPKPAPTVDPTICKSGDPNNDCQVDIDPNMIPVKYNTETAAWKSVADPEAADSDWYNYGEKQWANAVTVKNPQEYKGQAKSVKQSDILGFWVYIPRYAYEVMRRDGTDKPVKPQNFLISFEKVTPSTKKQRRSPAACPEQGKDYRTECGLNRDYIKGKPSAQGTWATHPAFTADGKQLNGIWFAKFETTGEVDQPTVLPNQYHISGYTVGINYRIGSFYTLAKSLGVNDSNNIGGYNISATQNSHHLAKLSSHMVNNNDWGAATYLSASKYGAGYNGVQINSQSKSYDINSSINGNDTYGTTGCGPSSNGNTGSYSDGGTLGTQSACSSSNPQRAYNGTLGQFASTTNNVYGIYDMSGGGWEYVAASYTSDPNYSNTKNFGTKAQLPYVNSYSFDDPNKCIFATCGGQALYETNDGGSNSGTQWNGNYSNFVNSLGPWFTRGGGYFDNSYAGLFFAGLEDGYASRDSAFRVAFAPAPHD